MVKVFFADAGDLAQLRSTLADVVAEAEQRVTTIGTLATEGNPFPERAHISALALPLALEQEIAVLGWARWALEQVRSWQDTTDPGDWDGAASLRSVARRALDAVENTSR